MEDTSFNSPVAQTSFLPYIQANLTWKVFWEEFSPIWAQCEICSGRSTSASSLAFIPKGRVLDPWGWKDTALKGVLNTLQIQIVHQMVNSRITIIKRLGSLYILGILITKGLFAAAITFSEIFRCKEEVII